MTWPNYSNHIFSLLFINFFQEYKLLFEGAGSNPGDKTLEDRFFEHEVSMIMREDRGDNELSEVRGSQKGPQCLLLALSYVTQPASVIQHCTVVKL